MALTLLDLYNTAASQEWSMYDDDAVSGSEMEKSLIIAINKAIIDIYASYDFPFRERTHVILTVPNVCEYDMPYGIVKCDENKNMCVKCNNKNLNHINNISELTWKHGLPEGFLIKNDKIIFYPIPSEKVIITIDYFTLTIGETIQGEEIFALKNADDMLIVPVYLEELMKEAIITRTMLNTIASESDENFSAYKQQADKAYKLLIKCSKGVGQEKKVLL